MQRPLELSKTSTGTSQMLIGLFPLTNTSFSILSSPLEIPAQVTVPLCQSLKLGPTLQRFHLTRQKVRKRNYYPHLQTRQDKNY